MFDKTKHTSNVEKKMDDVGIVVIFWAVAFIGVILDELKKKKQGKEKND